MIEAIALLVLTLAGFFGIPLWQLMARRRKLGRMAALPRWRIADLPDGTHGRIAGTIGQHATLAIAPLSRRRCAVWRVKVYRQVASSRRNRPWRLVLDVHDGVPFVVDDGSGRALIEPRAADAELRVSHRAITGGGCRRLQQRELELLVRHGIDLGRGLSRDGFRFEESVIAIGASVAVIGAGRREAVGAAEPGTYRDAPGRWLRIDGSVQLSDARRLIG